MPYYSLGMECWRIPTLTSAKTTAHTSCGARNNVASGNGRRGHEPVFVSDLSRTCKLYASVLPAVSVVPGSEPMNQPIKRMVEVRATTWANILMQQMLAARRLHRGVLHTSSNGEEWVQAK